jgi:hypothetical protein
VYKERSDNHVTFPFVVDINKMHAAMAEGVDEPCSTSEGDIRG